MNFNMNLIIMASFLFLYTGKVVNGKCRGEGDCAKDECCVAMYIFQLATDGVCMKLSEEGRICQVADAKLNYYGGKYIYSCPCKKGLVCKNEKDVNVTYALSLQPPTRNCVKLSTDAQKIPKVLKVTTLDIGFYKTNSEAELDALKRIARKAVTKKLNKRDSAYEDDDWEEGGAYSDSHSAAESEFDGIPMQDDVSQLLPDDGFKEEEDSKHGETDERNSSVEDDFEDDPIEDDINSSHRHSPTGLNEHSKDDELEGDDLEEIPTKKPNVSRNPMNQDKVSSQISAHGERPGGNNKKKKLTHKITMEDDPVEDDVSLSNSRNSDENDMDADSSPKEDMFSPGESPDSDDLVSDFGDVATSISDGENPTDYDLGEEPKEDSNLYHIESTTQIDLKDKLAKQIKKAPIPTDSSMEYHYEKVEEVDSKHDEPLDSGVEIPAKEGYDDASYGDEKSVKKDDPKEDYVVDETEEDGDQSNIWDYL